MSDFQEKLDSIVKQIDKLNKPLELPTYDSIPQSFFQPPVVHIKEEDTIIYQFKQIIEKQREQNDLLTEQNQYLGKSNEQLKNLLAAKENELNEEKAETKKAKQYNIIMLIIAVVSAIIAFLTWFFPLDPKNKDTDNSIVITESNTDSSETVLSTENESSGPFENTSETAVDEVTQ